MKGKVKRNLQGFFIFLFIGMLVVAWVMNSLKDFVRGLADGIGTSSAAGATISDKALFIVTGIFASVLIILLFLILKKYVSDPVKRLSANMEKVRGGDLEVTMEVVDSFEFGRMEESFNTMVQGLREAREQQNANEEKNRKLYAEIAHDLKTPMTMILGYAKLLSAGKVSEDEQKKYLQTIVEQTESANALLEQMLEYAKLGSTEYRLELQEKDLAECLRQVAAESYYRFEEKNMELDVEIPEGEVAFAFDERQMKRVFYNLVGNVIGHNPEGTKVKILMKREKKLEIWIADNGQPIEAGLKEHLFEPFQAGEASLNSRGGSGLGLSVARKIVRLHGGDLVYQEELLPGFKGFVIAFDSSK